MDQDESNERVATNMGYQIQRKSQLQIECTLSATKSERIWLTSVTQRGYSHDGMLRAIQDAEFVVEFVVESNQTQVHCKVCEDNNGALAIAKY